jgi:two-component system sensor histidine kinase SenX3
VIEGLGLLGAGLVGLLIGMTAALAFTRSERSEQTPALLTEPDISQGVAAVLATLPSGVIVLDLDDDVVRANAASYALGIIRNDAIVHREITDLITKVRADGVIRTAELELPRGPLGNGKVVVHVRVANLSAEQVLILVDDRSEAARVEAIRRDFVANISHELKTPVGALALLAETVESAADDPDAVRQFAAQMNAEAHRLGVLVSEIIELSRVQSAGALTDFELVELDEVIAEAIDGVRVRAEAQDIRVMVAGDDGLLVFGEEGLLIAAVRNLLDNAITYSDPHSRVNVGVRGRDGIAEITVVDQGMGISAEDLDRVFERFYRVDPARTRDTGGTGLGLSIVKHVASEHGGDVSAWSLPGKGSTFTMRIPLAQVHSSEELAQSFAQSRKPVSEGA